MFWDAWVSEARRLLVHLSLNNFASSDTEVHKECTAVCVEIQLSEINSAGKHDKKKKSKIKKLCRLQNPILRKNKAGFIW